MGVAFQFVYSFCFWVTISITVTRVVGDHMFSILCRGTGNSLVLRLCVRLLLDGRNSVVLLLLVTLSSPEVRQKFNGHLPLVPMSSPLSARLTEFCLCAICVFNETFKRLCCWCCLGDGKRGVSCSCCARVSSRSWS